MGTETSDGALGKDRKIAVSQDKAELSGKAKAIEAPPPQTTSSKPTPTCTTLPSSIDRDQTPSAMVRGDCAEKTGSG